MIRNVLLTLFIAFFAVGSQAQNCNPGFQYTTPQPGTLSFFPVITGGNGVCHFWDFGNGTNSMLENPTVTFSTSGVYQVKHKVSIYNPNGVLYCADSITQTITVLAPCNIIANYTIVQDSLINNKFYFTNTSTGTQLGDTIRWTFNDGTPPQIGVNLNTINHTFLNGGIYTVCMRISRPNTITATPCVKEICKPLTVTNNTPTCNANFTYTNIGLNYTFVSTANSVNVKHRWAFGDGSSANNLATVNHTYSGNGTYLVKHVVEIWGNNNQILCADSAVKTITTNTQVPCNIVANFTYARDSLNRKLFYFQNTSLGYNATDSIRWNFGDGSPFQYIQNPIHLFANYGTYNVCIRVKRPVSATSAGCVDEYCMQVVVDSLPTVNCNATFTVTQQLLNITCISLPSMIAAPHSWTLGDGGTSNAPNPSYVYAAAGTYVIKHIVKRYGNSNTPLCVDSFMQTITTVAPTICNIQANFTSTRDSINRKKFYFNNTSTGTLPTDSIRWNFGDNTGFQYGSNVNHTYANYGVYTVCVRISRVNAPGTVPCVRELCKVIIVDSLPITTSCTANFTVTGSGNNYTFTPVMLGTNVQHTWHYGNGVSSSLAVPTYTYPTAGVYVVKHVVKLYSNSNTPVCADSTVKTITVTITAPCNLQANFIWAKDSINKKKIYFSNTSLGFLATDSIRWSFGDGSPFVYTTNPIYTYANYGVYNVCIRVKRNVTNATGTPCVSEICKTVLVDSFGVITTNPCNYIVNFTMLRDSLMLNKVHFTNTSTQIAGATATWYFGDGSTANTWNAVHTYTNASGVYQPCLRITYNNTCSKTACKVLQLSSKPSFCTLQPYPNPTTNIVNATVQLTTPTVIYTRVFNANNFIVRQQQQSGLSGFNLVSVNVASLPQGVYRLEIQYANSVCRGLFIKQ